MKKMAVVYWSGTGNTEEMANAVVQGAKDGGCEVQLFKAADFNKELAEEFDLIAFGCPSMGAEVLEEEEFEPMYLSCKEKLSGKPVALFGSYGWGDGEWMRLWEEDVLSAGAELPCGYLIINERPDAAGIESCKELGAGLARA
ncbi:flavodoxin [Clostridium aminobutyricum]|uniref:Flavodoxin n=1 Tax=Clostridium aminobutyricum TaxID=33953 RepID=A0A939D913_CLOAM|nr:flavodoxin [Clostridium aminobutyricum]MBN7773416.1 flavodoxin [Clostridium aminobutyricum]